MDTSNLVNTYLFNLKLSLFGLDCLVNVIIFLTDSPQSRAHFFVLFITKLPRRDDVVWFEEGVLRHEIVLSTQVIISVRNI